MIATARRVDHYALTVPDLDVAVDFIVDVIGGELVYRLPPLAYDDDWMQRYLDVHPRASCEIALLRLGPTTNLELFEYTAPDHNPVPPGPHEVGSTQLGLYVEDVPEAVTALRDWLPVLTVTTDAARLMAPWRMPIELRSYPESVSPGRFGPCPLWSNRDDGTPAKSRVPGLRNVDHIGYTVANLDDAVTFFLDTLGAELLYRKGTEHAALRVGPTDNVELNCHGSLGAPPRNSDVGGRHLALHVDDVDAAAAQLADVPGCTVLGGPETITEGPIAGDRWVYVRTRIGLHIELVRMPDGALPYERETTARRRAAGGLQWTDR